ncbi:class A beta-lactamase-related serine hydrolase [Rhodococcus sp. F64268]|uniref:serine hydrolase n=1 Tax=Rhodococcus sp. F64268 TaxID=2926402 RepID=UPI001FF66092|nr:serine hydrolase [Rhodococcus sp. F64268]MCK0092471.1 class A beta-lactamase-related serine hydrolase [Rhodococcus sp. F64268]
MTRDRFRSGLALLVVAATLSACGTPLNGLTAPGSEVSAAGLHVAAGASTDITTPIRMDGLADRIDTATRLAAERGAEVTVAILDRDTGARTVGGVDEPIETASVVKLFIADDLLFREGIGEILLTDDHYDLIRAMLTRSDDSAASLLWDAFGGPEIVARVVERHALRGTVAPVDFWWNTLTTASDILTWYDHLLGSTDGFDEPAGARIIGYLLEWEPTGADGYDQQFGLSAGLPDTVDLGSKAGWMCCLGSQWIHLSTGFFGDDHRYVVAVLSRETVTYEDPEYDGTFLPDTSMYDASDDQSARHARDTLTMVVETVFG